MSKTILFSPVGGTDPISLSNIRDGSLLHICRVYRPDKIIMYMSREILDFHKLDNRYCYCIDRLAELLDHQFEYEIVERPNLTEVQDFDFYYEDFSQILKKLMDEMEAGDRLLLNTSSGTPSMKSGLLVLQTLGDYPCTAIQVSTPTRKMNEHIHKDYDVSLLWELNEDNTRDFENRCKEIKCLNLSRLKNEEIIKRHVLAYDYAAALSVAEAMPEEYTKTYIHMLEFALFRESLDFKALDNMSSLKIGFQLPVRDRNYREYMEYALELDIKGRQKKYADFIRAISPLFVDLLVLALKKNTSVKLEDYCSITEGTLKWDQRKLKDTDVLKVLNRENGGYFQGTYMQSMHIMQLIKEYAADDKLKKLVEDIRDVEQSVRNLAAHQIITVNEQRIKNLTKTKDVPEGYSADQIMSMIKALFKYTEIPVKKEYWDSYDDMNQKILSLM